MPGTFGEVAFCFSAGSSRLSQLRYRSIPRFSTCLNLVSHGTSPSQGISNLHSDEPQAAASSRCGTIKSTAVPWVYGKSVRVFFSWHNREDNRDSMKRAGQPRAGLISELISYSNSRRFNFLIIGWCGWRIYNQVVKDR